MTNRFRAWLVENGPYGVLLILLWFGLVVAWADPAPRREIPTVLLEVGFVLMALYLAAAVWVVWRK